MRPGFRDRAIISMWVGVLILGGAFYLTPLSYVGALVAGALAAGLAQFVTNLAGYGMPAETLVENEEVRDS